MKPECFHVNDIEKLAREFQKESPTRTVSECWERAESWLQERSKRTQPMPIDRAITYIPKIEERP